MPLHYTCASGGPQSFDETGIEDWPTKAYDYEQVQNVHCIVIDTNVFLHNLCCIEHIIYEG